MIIRTALHIAAAVMMLSVYSYGQVSPGPLAKVHRDLEGLTNCTKCHEHGKEITGKKCLSCHPEVAESPGSYHARNSSVSCLNCHKDHLGKNAAITKFDKNSFNHSQTGYALTGKHQNLKCDQCHTSSHIVSSMVQSIVKKYPHTTYLGLQDQCRSCHADRHQNSLSSECETCHSTQAWNSMTSFSHAKTKYPLAGKHVSVQCAACHESLKNPGQNTPIVLKVERYSDCVPCHTSPHDKNFSRDACSTCHKVEGWKETKSSFNHSTTKFPLKGSHATTKCAQCHIGTGAKSLHVPLKCSGCHKDEHKGVFAERYHNDCSKCHDEQTFKSSLYTISSHNTTRFQLTGAHAAISCRKCHTKNNKLTFVFTNLTCAGCHSDVHKGGYDKYMKTGSCTVCHTIENWSVKSFNHSITSYPLEGKHRTVACVKCHTERTADIQSKFKSAPVVCSGCHKDIHDGQFAKNDSTSCNNCHSSAGWTTLLFRHDQNSSFALTGAHVKVECAACHKTEIRNYKPIVIYKPVSTRCESCHKGKQL